MKALRIALAVFLLLIGITAVGGGLELTFNYGLGMSIELIGRSPFSSYTYPGVILLVIVGGTHLLASFLLYKHHHFALEASAVAGFGLLIWVFTELWVVLQPHILQAPYFRFAVITLVAVMLLKYDLDVRKP